MAIGDSAINICSRALVGIGAEGISGFEEGTTEAKVAANKYETAKKDLLAIYPWTFAQNEAYLARTASDELAVFKYLYAKPLDCLRLITTKNQYGSILEYTFRNGQINTDCEAPIGVYIADVREEDMPTYFVSLLIDRLSRDFIIPLTAKHDEYSIYDKIYQNSLMLAKNADAQSKTTSRLDTSLLMRIR